MCAVVPALLIASAAVSAYGAYAQNKAQQKAYSANSQNIGEDFSNQMSDIASAQDQIGDDADTEMSERVRTARSEAARVSVIAGEYADGNNTKRLQNEVSQHAADDLSTIELNRGRQQSELGRDASASRIRAKSGIQSLSRPSRTQLGLAVAGSALGAANTWQRNRPPSNTSQP